MDTADLITKPGVPRNRIILIALWLFFYATFALVTPPLLDDADSVHAEVAREMILRHDWVTLYANGIRYLEKAPFLYWSMAASFQLFGPNTAAARLPLAFAVLALALALESFARRAFRSVRAGLYAALILLSSFGIFIFTRITIPDAFVCLWLTLALYCYWLTEPSNQTGCPTSASSDVGSSPATNPPANPQNRVPHLRDGLIVAKVGMHEGNHFPSLDGEPGAPSIAASPRWVGSTRSTGKPNPLLCWAFAACCALNVLTKGLIGIVFPLAIVFLHLVLTRRGIGATFKRILELHPISSTIVFLAISAPWHILIALANPTQGNPGSITFLDGHWFVPLPTLGNVHGWAWFYFVNDQFLRYLNLRVPRDYGTVPLLVFWGLLLIWLMPWSAFLFKALARIPLRKALRPRFSIRTLTPTESTLLLLGLWAAVPLVFFSFSTRQEYYVLPSIPALVLLLAAWLHDEATEAESFTVPNPLTRSGQRIASVLLVLGSLAALLALFFVFHTPALGPNADLAALLRQNPGDYALSFGHFLDLDTRAMGAFHSPLLLTAFALFGGTLANWLLRRDYKPHAANLWLAAATFAFLLAAHMGLQIFSPVLTSEPLAAAIAPVIRPDDLIVIHGEYEAASTLGFYLQRPAADTKPIHILNGRSSNLWYGSFFTDAPPIFEDDASLRRKWLGVRRIFLWQDLDDPLPPLPAKPFFITQSGGKEILSNQPNPY